MSFNPGRQLHTKPESIGELLKSSYFVIPPNQREYRWGYEQRQKLWEDLIATIQSDFESDSREEIGHFLGAVVVIGKEKVHDQDRWEVIDGQQRLTTITILASCLIVYAQEIDDRKIRRNLEHVLTDCFMSPSSNEAPRIRLNREDDFYQNSIINYETLEEKRSYWDSHFKESSEVQRNIKDAFEFFFKRIDEYLDCQGEERQDKIRNIIEALTENFYILEVRTERIWLAYRLFETLNERGLDLSQADLIRNKLLEHAREEGSAVVTKVSNFWSEMTDLYEDQAEKKLQLPQIIQFSYTSRYKVVKKEDIFDRVSEDLIKGSVSAEEFAFQFWKDAQAWSSFLLGDLKKWTEELSDSQYAITDPLWKAHCAPFVIAAMEMYSGEPDTLKKLFTLTEHFLFRQGLVCRDTVGNLQAFFGNAARLLRGKEDLKTMCTFFKEHSGSKNFVENFKTFSVGNMKQGFYVVWKIESELMAGCGVKPRSQSAAQHLEHIMPRKPDDSWRGIENDENFKPYLNRIGNLLILDRKTNQYIRNCGIEFKIKNDNDIDYSNSENRLAREFVENFDDWSVNGDWTFKSIDKRQEYLAENYADKVWSLDIVF